MNLADARESLEAFCGAIEIPGAPVDPADEACDLFEPVRGQLAAHHKLLIRKLEAVERGAIRRLMVFMPPGSAKSTYASVVFPVWFMGRKPRRNVIVATYASELARKIGRRARSIVNQPVFAEVFGCALSPVSRAADEWALTNDNEWMGGGILSGITGNRADCLRGDSLVLTEAGLERIEDLVGRKYSGNVLSYDEHTRELVRRRVQAVARRSSPDFYRVRTASGRVVECTGDHRIYTSRGYVQARFLACGDVLLRVVRNDQPAPSLSDTQGRKGRGDTPILQSSLPDDGDQRRGGQSGSAMRGVRNGAAADKFQSEAREPILLRGLREGGSPAAMGRLPAEDSRTPMRAVREGISTGEQQCAGAVLLTGVQRSRSRRGHGWGSKPSLEEWRQSAAPPEALRARLSEGQAENHRAGRISLCDLRGHREFARPPHRHECFEQQMVEPRDPLRDLPHEMACRGSLETEADAVAVVERICEPTAVFDIQVEGTRCFFANGILVHNCLIIDDPVKGRQEADSETVRARTKAEYEDSLRTRLKPGGRIVLIQTRWHEADLAGAILPESWDGESGPVRGRDGETWEVLCLPAEAGAGDPLGRKPGEMLWPEWFDEAHWRAFRGQGRTWAALYQQRPQPEDGAYFQRGWFRRYGPDELPRALRIYGTSDYAVTDDGGDFTVLRLWGVDPESRLWLLPWGWRGQTSADVWIERQIDLISAHRPFAWFGEAGVIQKAIEPSLRRRMFERRAPCRLEWLPSIADKPTRARGVQARAAMGLVALPEGPEGEAVLSELLRFPAGRHDDEVDCASLIGRALDEVHPALVAPPTPPPGAPRGVAAMTFEDLMRRQERAEQGRERI